MKLNFTKFIETGKFGLIEIGNSKHEILGNNLTPESWLNDYTKENSPIWRFGNTDFHFENSNILTRITNNYLPKIDCGKSIDIIDWWLFNNGYLPNLQEVSENLTLIGLGYEKETDNLNITKVELGNGVFFSFENLGAKSEENLYQKHKISVMGLKNKTQIDFTRT